MNQRLTFETMQGYGTIAGPQKATSHVMRTVRDGTELREELIAAGVLRPFDATSKRGGFVATFLLDDDALDDTAARLFASSESEAQLQARIEQADARIASRLEALRARHSGAAPIASKPKRLVPQAPPLRVEARAAPRYDFDASV